MDLAAAGLREQPFRTHGRPVSVVPYGAYSEAVGVLSRIRQHPTGLGLLQGPPLSGKTTILRQYASSVEEDCWAAVIDARGLNSTGLFEATLRQFGYALDHSSASELFAMLRVFSLQQAASHEPPLLIVDNAQALTPSALSALCELAKLRARHLAALKIVLAGERPLAPVLAAAGREALERRVVADFHLQPMSAGETVAYLESKLESAGCEAPQGVFPDPVCRVLWRASGGWPGIVDRIALLALARAETLPVDASLIERAAVPAPTAAEAFLEEPLAAADGPAAAELIVSHSGNTLSRRPISRARILIGRSEHNDVTLDSHFVSRHHFLLVRNGGTTFLMDLNSTNGTYVNSRRVSNQVLMHEDVITVGDHRIKFRDPHATARTPIEGAAYADTTIMKTLEDMRRLLAQENTQLMPAAGDDKARGQG